MISRVLVIDLVLIFGITLLLTSIVALITQAIRDPILRAIIVDYFSNLIKTRYVRILNLPNIPTDGSTVRYDLFKIHRPLGNGWVVLYEGHCKDRPKEDNSIILVNSTTGKQFKFFLPKD